MKYLQVFEKWVDIDPSKWEQSSKEEIICPFCLKGQFHYPSEICPKWTSTWDCESCGEVFYIDKECVYHTFKP